MRYFSLAVPLTLAVFGCNSSYGTPQDCTAAGGQCVLGGGNLCAKKGPDNTCNCNPLCNPGGTICCVAFIDAGDARDGD